MGMDGEMGRGAYPREELQRDMMRGFITEPLLGEIRENPSGNFDIIIALNESWAEGVRAARQMVVERLAQLEPPAEVQPDGVNYVFAKLPGRQILRMAELYRSWVNKGGHARKGPIYRVWKDLVVNSCLTSSVATVKADAARRAFNATGDGICWAVLDSGIDKSHPHFDLYDNLNTSWSEDFTGAGNPFTDDFGHGTHVAGIIAGEWKVEKAKPVAAQETLAGGGTDGAMESEVELLDLDEIAGVAPKTKLVSLKVLDAAGGGKVSWVLRALERIQEINQHGRRLTLPGAAIHGVNLSLGYDFNPRWFGCGQSPICVEVDRLVRSGVAVVVAAGNSGFSSLNRNAQGSNELGYRDLSINDPGNAELAATVGSTHRDSPHTYGVSYFSSRGPTGDGRPKPDLVAPGERIVSCAAGTFKEAVSEKLKAGAEVLYLEQSGTSMAAPHVSGAMAAFLSVRREFIGRPEKVKQVFLESSIDLKRERTFQGCGLVDLLKALQAV
ncbi:MAG TPA: S8 family peptidase [Bryobacteraceae bacterium]|nr:S8 family peptidase [Bryobacteraceae bacterium]HPT28820.1 S8 family peptidase [Bryobacteraceae bacterium]